jgi:hypothetical protein
MPGEPEVGNLDGESNLKPRRAVRLPGWEGWRPGPEGDRLPGPGWQASTATHSGSDSGGQEGSEGPEQEEEEEEEEGEGEAGAGEGDAAEPAEAGAQAEPDAADADAPADGGPHAPPAARQVM